MLKLFTSSSSFSSLSRTSSPSIINRQLLCASPATSTSASLFLFSPTLPLLAPKKKKASDNKNKKGSLVVVQKKRTTSSSKRIDKNKLIIINNNKSRRSTSSSTKDKTKKTSSKSSRPKSPTSTSTSSSKSKKKVPRIASSSSSKKKETLPVIFPHKPFLLPPPEPKSTYKKKSRNTTTTSTSDHQQLAPQPTMPQNKYFAIVRGTKTGIIYDNWDNVRDLVIGFRNAKFQGFKREEDAKRWFNAESRPIVEGAVAENKLMGVAAQVYEATQHTKQEISKAKATLQNNRRRGRDDDDDFDGDEATDFEDDFGADNNGDGGGILPSFDLNELSFFGSLQFPPRTSEGALAITHHIHGMLNTSWIAEKRGHHRSFSLHEHSIDVTNSQGRKKLELPVLCAFTDGGCSNNGRPNAAAGCGIALSLKTTPNARPEFVGFSFPLDATNHDPRRREKQTNQRAELTACVAILSAVERAEQEKRDQEGKDVLDNFVIVDISTDSMYCINGAIDWRHKWQREGRNINQVENGDLWATFFSLLEARDARLEQVLQSKGINVHQTKSADQIQAEKLRAVNWNWVRGHQTGRNLDPQAIGNQEADRRATAGSLMKSIDSRQLHRGSAHCYCTSGLLLRPTAVFSSRRSSSVGRRSMSQRR